jgi:hypothetical protein
MLRGEENARAGVMQARGSRFAGVENQAFRRACLRSGPRLRPGFGVVAPSLSERRRISLVQSTPVRDHFGVVVLRGSVANQHFGRSGRLMPDLFSSPSRRSRSLAILHPSYPLSPPRTWRCRSGVSASDPLIVCFVSLCLRGC